MTKGRKRKQRQASAVDPSVSRVVRPTAHREAHNDFQSSGMAYRCTPVIETLLAAKKLTHAEYDALNYYRVQAHQAEDDCAVEGTLSPAKIMGGGGGSIMGGHIPASLLFTPAIAETGRIERVLGSLRPIARAIAVEDMTLTRWCIAQHGGRERYDGDGKFVAMVPLSPGKSDVIGIALMELRFAAKRIAK